MAHVIAGNRGSAWRDVTWAVGVALLSFGVYWATLAPGLIGQADSPKFQFVGRVLGVPHSPGYPLYVLVSHAFSYLPFGSLAYRINLMSAVFGAVTTGLIYLVLRRFGCHSVISASVALAAGFGRVLWSVSVVAEVYTLHAALVAGTLLALLVWGQERRASAYYVCVALFALGLGNHTTVVLLAPALLVYALAVDARWLIHASRLVITAGILTLGLAQYGFIVLRTLQRAPYLEARASNVGELFDVMRGLRWKGQLFVFDLPTLALERAPLSSRILSDELGAAGLVLAAVGVVYLLQRHRAEATLLLLGTAVTAGFGLNLDTPELPPFFISTILLLWVLSGVGFDRISRAAASRGHIGLAAVVIVAAVLPFWLLWLNYGANDRSRETSEIRFFRALFQQLPTRSVFVTEDYVVDRMIDYKVLGEHAQGAREVVGPVSGRRVSRIERLWQEGYDVFAFPRWTRRLRLQGLRLAPFPLFVGASRDEGFRVPLAEPRRRIFRLQAPRLCQDVSDSVWQQYGEITASGKVILRVPHQNTVVLYVGRETPLAPRVTNVSERTKRNVEVRSFGPDQSGRSALRVAMAQDAFAAGEDLLGARFVHRVAVTLEHAQAITSAVALALRGITRVAWARGDSTSSGEPAELCVAVVGNNGLFGDPRVRTERIEHRELFGYGWGPVQQGRVDPFRWTTARQAELLLPLWRVGPLRVQFTARSAPGPEVSRGTVQLQVNETVLNPIALRPGWSSYEWDVPSTALQEGVNQAYLIVSKLQQPSGGRTVPQPGVAVRGITLAFGV